MSSIEKYINKLNQKNSDSVSQKPASLPPDFEIQGEPKDVSSKPAEYINLAQLKSMGIITPDTVSSRILDEFRMIKRPLLENVFNPEITSGYGNVIMVTSSLPQEGKTYTAINLAMSIVLEMDFTVLLVEADLHRPAIANYMGLDIQLGLGEYLLGGKKEITNYIAKTNVPKLAILPAGKGFQASTELVGSNNMKQLIGKLASRYSDRVIIVDTPPLLSCNDAAVISQLAGQIVVVVESGKTPQSAVKTAVAQLDRTKATSIVLNKNLGGVGSGAGYYDGYGV